MEKTKDTSVSWPEAIDTKMELYCNYKFQVWVDRQIRPTVGANVYKGKDRKDADFIEIIETLLKLLENYIPQHIPDVYMTFSGSDWKRTSKFHVKVHLTTDAYLELTAKLCEQESSPFAAESETLKQREENDNRAPYLRKFFEGIKPPKGECVLLNENSGFSCVHAKHLYYPLVGLRKGKSAELSLSDLLEALPVIEDFVEEKELKKTAIGMVFSKSKDRLANVAAIMDEVEFAELTKKKLSEVKKSWPWTEPIRKRYK